MGERRPRTITAGIELQLSDREADHVRRHVYAVQLRELSLRRDGRRRWPL